MPTYMVPQKYRLIDHFPLNANGKVDLAKILEKEKEEKSEKEVVDAGEDFLTSLHPTIEQGLLIWSKELGIRPTSKASFFEAGGHSLVAARIASRIRSESNLEVGAYDILKASEIFDLIEVLQQAMEKDHLASVEKVLTPSAELEAKIELDIEEMLF